MHWRDAFGLHCAAAAERAFWFVYFLASAVTSSSQESARPRTAKYGVGGQAMQAKSRHDGPPTLANRITQLL